MDKGMFDPSWDLIDPHPDIYALFKQFDTQFFKKRLEVVQVSWSRRMTSCAGICYFNPKNLECVIRLSEPLLKLRTRKDLIETLLHEMIHAYLFVTNNNSDRDDHGPRFCHHMELINKTLGSNITIYHTFHDEVDVYKVHVWKCDGPCRHQAPYFGTVKRAMNRPPGKNDRWWEYHQNTCSGTFRKIAGPKTRAELKEEAKKSKLMTPNTFGATKGYKLGTSVPSATVTSGALLPIVNVKSNNGSKSENLLVPATQGSKEEGKYPDIFKSPRTKPREAECPICMIAVPLYSINKHLDDHYRASNVDESKVVWDKCVICDIHYPKHVLEEHQKLCLENVFSGATDLSGQGKENVGSTANEPDDNLSIVSGTRPRPTDSVNGKYANGDNVKMVDDSMMKDVELVVKCPVCSRDVIESRINDHLDICMKD